jgi:hypothetical protein
MQGDGKHKVEIIRRETVLEEEVGKTLSHPSNSCPSPR